MAEAAMIPSGRGVIYLALGASYIAEARISAESVRRFMPELTLVLFTDCPPADRGVFDEVMPLERVHAKAHINKLSAHRNADVRVQLSLSYLRSGQRKGRDSSRPHPRAAFQGKKSPENC
jgi:hypothetical protein